MNDPYSEAEIILCPKCGNDKWDLEDEIVDGLPRAVCKKCRGMYLTVDIWDARKN